MALDSTPPWRRARDPRSRWLLEDRPGHGRRDRDRRPRRSRTRSAHREARSWRSSRARPARPSARPACTSHTRAPVHVETVHDDEDTVPVEVEPQEAFTTEDAMQVWLSLMELRPEGDERNNLGLPRYLLNNIQATLDDYSAEDCATLLAAFAQLTGLFQAQVAQLVDARVRTLRSAAASGSHHGGTEGDGLSLMQGSVFRALRGEISTFALHMQHITDELSSASEQEQSARAQVLSNLLADRYGSGVGRRLMLNRAQSLEAVTGAFSGNGPPCPPSEDDSAWARRWWNVLLPAIRSEESLLAMPGPSVVVNSSSTQAVVEETQVDASLLDAAGVGNMEAEDPGDAEHRLHLECMREREDEARAEYEQMQAEEVLYDEQRWEDYVEARDERATSSSESSTERIDRRKWEEVAMRDQLAWAASKRLRGPGDDPVLNPTTSPTERPEMPAARGRVDEGSAVPDGMLGGLYVENPLSFVQSPLGQIVYRWWHQGLVPSLLVASDLGLTVLQAFRNQRQLTEGS